MSVLLKRMASNPSKHWNVCSQQCYNSSSSSLTTKKSIKFMFGCLGAPKYISHFVSECSLNQNGCDLNMTLCTKWFRIKCRHTEAVRESRRMCGCFASHTHTHLCRGMCLLFIFTIFVILHVHFYVFSYIYMCRIVFVLRIWKTGCTSRVQWC